MLSGRRASSCSFISAWALLTLSACGSHGEPGVRIQLISAPATLAPGEELSTSAGAALTVDDFRWASTEIELERCPSAWRGLVQGFIREAHAHGESTPTLTATPFVLSAGSAEDVQLAEMNPPAGRYCGVRYRLAPADADAVGLSETPPMLGRSFYLRGRMGSSGEPLAALEVSSDRTLDIAVDADFELSADIRSMTLRFELDPELWFQNFDRTLASGGVAESAVLESFRGALTLRVE